MKKKYIYASAAALLLLIILSYYVFFSEDESGEKQVENKKLHNAIKSYTSISDYDAKVMLWREMMKACPYWQNYVSNSYNLGKYKKLIDLGLTLDDHYTYLAIGFVEDNESIENGYKLCLE